MAFRSGFVAAAQRNGVHHRTHDSMVAGPADFRKLEQSVEIFSVHPEVLALLKPSAGVMEHVRHVRDENAHATEGQPKQSEFLIVKFKPELSMAELEKAAMLLHAIRGREKPTRGKVEGLKERGFMLVDEPNAIVVMRRMLPKAFCDVSPINVLR